MGKKRIAVVGTGVTGLGAAWALSREHEVIVYERETRLGGHSNTIEVETHGRRIPVDTGFIVYNEVNYPHLTALFRALNVVTEESCMSFSVSARGGRIEWAGDNLGTVFAQKRNALNPVFLVMLRDILRFNREAKADLQSGALAGLTLGAYLDARRYGKGFLRDYLLPMGAAIWSAPLEAMRGFPAESFVRFFDNHALLSGFEGRHLWRTVTGGSREYVARVSAPFAGSVRLGTPVVSVTREAGGVRVRDGLGGEDTFDDVVIAAHGDEALAMLSDADAHERAILGRFTYQMNDAWLHSDERLMPRRRSVWTSWNYLSGETPDGLGAVSVTYWMNRLQNIDRRIPIFVTLNPLQAPDPAKVHRRITYHHPLFDAGAIAAQARLSDIQGRRRTWFCGSYCGHGFHEDGLRAGLEVAAALDAPAPWMRRAAAA
jgi:predicted NAD/FAD-binding protein